MPGADWVRVRCSRGRLLPGFLDPESERHRARAAQVVELLETARVEAHRRQRIDEAVATLVGDAVDHRIVRGLVHVALKRATFAEPGEPPPAELRECFFARVGRRPGRSRAAAALRELAAELDRPPGEVAEALYADRRSQQRLVALDLPGPTWLLHRYNVALVQAVLLRAVELEVEIAGITPARARMLFRTLRFHQLMHRIAPTGEGYRVVVDGPASLLRQSTRYGRQLAAWFPDLLLTEARWSMVATVLWTRRNLRRRLEIDHALGLRSHHRERGAWTSRTEAWFEERFRARDRGWTLEADGTPIPLGGQAVVVPSFTFRQGARVAHLDVVGFWRREWLERHVALLRDHGPGNLVLALSHRFRAGRDLPDLGPVPVVRFKEVVPIGPVLEAIEQVAIIPGR